MLKDIGVCYSILLELPYFDPIRFHVIDPMHNLLLGSAKHVMETWTTFDILTKAKFKLIEELGILRHQNILVVYLLKFHLVSLVLQLINGKIGP